MFKKSEIPEVKIKVNENKITYPYKLMEVGDCVELSADDVGYEEIFKARKYAHNYGSSSNKKFKTLKDGKILKVWRVK